MCITKNFRKYFGCVRNGEFEFHDVMWKVWCDAEYFCLFVVIWCSNVDEKLDSRISYLIDSELILPKRWIRGWGNNVRLKVLENYDFSFFMRNHRIPTEIAKRHMNIRMNKKDKIFSSKILKACSEECFGVPTS